MTSGACASVIGVSASRLITLGMSSSCCASWHAEKPIVVDRQEEKPSKAAGLSLGLTDHLSPSLISLGSNLKGFGSPIRIFAKSLCSGFRT